MADTSLILSVCNDTRRVAMQVFTQPEPETRPYLWEHHCTACDARWTQPERAVPSISTQTPWCYSDDGRRERLGSLATAHGDDLELVYHHEYRRMLVQVRTPDGATWTVA